jgi:hypothetical protein
MNLMVRPGISSEPRAWAYGPEMAGWILQTFWRAYVEGGDGAYQQPDFENLVRAGNIICLALMDGDMVRAQFGIQLMRNGRGPYTQFIFFTAHARLDLQRDLPAVVTAAWHASQIYKQAEQFHGEMRMRLVGRKGWRRVVQGLGLEMSKGGWISERQRYFRHGYVRRH